MSTDIEICSNALLLLGDNAISSFTESPAAETAGGLYPTVRNRILAGYPWRCCMQKAQLSLLVATPTNEWSYAFNLPSDRLANTQPRAVYVTSGVEEKADPRFDIFGDKLFFNSNTCYIDYWKDPGEQAYPAWLVTLLEYAMAEQLAEPVTDSTSKADHWRKIAFGMPSEQGKGGYYREARQLDAMSSSQQVIEDFSLIDARY